MTAQRVSQSPAQTLLERSIGWLKSSPPLLDVKKALSAIVAKVAKGELADDSDSRDTCDALTEDFVDRGGDLTDLPTLPELSAPAAELPPQLGSPKELALDYGSLCPDTPPAAPLSVEEKKRRLYELRAQITRPGGF